MRGRRLILLVIVLSLLDFESLIPYPSHPYPGITILSFSVLLHDFKKCIPRFSPQGVIMFFAIMMFLQLSRNIQHPFPKIFSIVNPLIFASLAEIFTT